MKQKYSIIVEAERNELVIKEYSELDKDEMTLLCQENYSLEMLRSAAANSHGDLVAALRTRNFFPPGGFAVKIAEAVASLIEDPSQPVVELTVDDKEHLVTERPETGSTDGPKTGLDEEMDADGDTLDELLDDGAEIPPHTSIKIAEDEPADIDTES